MTKPRFARRPDSSGHAAQQTSVFDGASERFARRLANRFTRRSFLGDVGKGGLALAVGGAFGATRVERARGNPSCGGCGACSGNSIRCDYMDPWNQNDCPDGSCWCGSWCSSNGPCDIGQTRWIDCCGGCDGGDNGICLEVGDRCAPKCCNPKEWPQGCDHSFVKCRIHRCSGC